MYIKKQQLLKKVMSKILLLFLCIVLFMLSLTSCNQYYTYPDYVTGEYFVENYYETMSNLYAADTVISAVSYDVPDGIPLAKYTFRKIVGVELSDFVCCSTSPGFMNGSGQDVILKHKNNSESPIHDWDIKSIKIYWQGIVIEDIEKSDLYDSIMNVATKDEEPRIDIHRYIKYPNGEFEKIDDFPNKTKYSIRITFKQSNKLEWRADIVEADGKYFFVKETKYNNIDYSINDVFYVPEYYCYIGEEFDALMK